MACVLQLRALGLRAAASPERRRCSPGAGAAVTSRRGLASFRSAATRVKAWDVSHAATAAFSSSIHFPVSAALGSPAPRRCAGICAASNEPEDVPPWERREIEKKAAETRGGLPWPAYLFFSLNVLLAAIGSCFEYSYKNPIFGVVDSDSALYAPILGLFIFSGFPMAFYLWNKGIAGANEASELQDKIDGY